MPSAHVSIWEKEGISVVGQGGCTIGPNEREGEGPVIALEELHPAVLTTQGLKHAVSIEAPLWSPLVGTS
jgi:hypothetical protein